MTLLSDLLIFTIKTCQSLISIYIFVVIISCLLSFVSPDPYNPLVRIIRRLTEPLFVTIRRYLPFVVVAGLDLSPLVLILLLNMVSSVFLPAFFRIAVSIGMGH